MATNNPVEGFDSNEFKKARVARVVKHKTFNGIDAETGRRRVFGVGETVYVLERQAKEMRDRLVLPSVAEAAAIVASSGSAEGAGDKKVVAPVVPEKVAPAKA